MGGGGQAAADPYAGIPEPLYSLLHAGAPGTADYYSPEGAILTGESGQAVTRTGERERLTEAFAPGRSAELQTAGLGEASPWFKSEQLARQSEGAGGGMLGSLDDYMATARKFLGVPEAGAAAAAPAPGTTAGPAGEAALTAARRPSTVSGISTEAELGEFPLEEFSSV